MPHYQVRASATNDKATELLIYGDIGTDWWAKESNDAKTVISKLETVPATDPIDVYINSFGGSAVESMAIYNVLKRHQGPVTIYIDAVAMSAASLIVMAGDTVVMASNGLLMIHGASTSTYSGSANEHRNTADMLDKYSEAMATSYAAKSGKTVEEMITLLKDGQDHFYTATEALAEGFINQIGAESDTITASAKQLKQRYTLPTAWLTTMQNQPQEKPMPATTEIKKPADNPAPAAAAPAPASITAEAQRQADINNIFALVPADRKDIHALMPTLLIDNTVTADAARAKILAKMGEGSAPVMRNTHIEMGMDQADKFRVGASAALQIRAGIAKRPDAANEYRGMTLYELAGHVLAMHAINYRDMSKMDRVAAAFTHTSDDFTYILKNTAEKSLLMGWEESPETYEQWTRKGQLPDFKAASRVGLDIMPSLLEIPEGAEYKHATIGDRGELVQLATYGRLFSITRQAIINDDLNAFTRIPQMQGRTAKRTIGNLVYAVLTGNPAMSDGDTLFHANHSNIAGTAAVPTSASVSAMRSLMALQKDPGENAAGLNIQLAYLLTPIALEDQANTVKTSAYRVDAATESKSTVPNSQKGRFEVIADPRLDAASATAWYGVANPMMHDTIEVSYLDGNDAPYLEQKEGWNVDGVEFKVRIDAGVKALDFRTFAKNAGA